MELENVVEEVVELETTEETTEETKEEIDLNNYIPKDTALAWKKQMKDLTKRIREYESKEQESEEKTRIDRIRNLGVEKGLGEEESEIFSEMAKELFKSIPKQDLVETEIESEIDELTEIYPEIKTKKKDLISTVKLYRKANPEFSVEDAYRLIAPNKSLREIKTAVEQRSAYKETEPILSNGGSLKKSPMTEEDKRVLRKMQTAHPDAGWTEQKFIKIMKR